MPYMHMLLNFSSHAEILQIIKEWNAELQERTGKFRKHANAVAEWDRRILQNRDILLRLEVFQHLTFENIPFIYVA